MAIAGTVIGAILVSTLIRLINGETWESANQFRTPEKAIFLVGYVMVVLLLTLSGDEILFFLLLFGVPTLIAVLTRESTPPQWRRPPDPP